MHMKLLTSSIVLLVIAIGCTTEGELSRSAPTSNPARRANAPSPASSSPTMLYDVRAFGATGNGETLDSPAINKAIEAAASSGGGTVYFPAGNYLSVSIHLKSNIALYLDQGATIVAADPKQGFIYDLPELNAFDKFQDFGHSHFRNSLIWGDGVENVAILGPGMIHGKGLVSGGGASRTKEQNAPRRPPRRQAASRSTTGEGDGAAAEPDSNDQRASAAPGADPATNPATNPDRP